MDREEIVAQWEALHGQLSDRHRSVFLARTEVDQLVALPRVSVEVGLLVGPKLTAVLRAATRHARELDQAAAEAATALRAHAQQLRAAGANPATPTPPAARPRPAKRRCVCLVCRREFVATLSAREPVTCRACGRNDEVHPVCRGCGAPGSWLLGGACQRCHDVRQVASDAAGSRASGPGGVPARAAGRRKRTWTSQLVEGPESDGSV